MSQISSTHDFNAHPQTKSTSVDAVVGSEAGEDRRPYFVVRGLGNRHSDAHTQYTSADDMEVLKLEALKKLLDHIAPGAIHSSPAHRDAPRSLPQTREAILNKISNWARDPHNHRLLMWIYGPAGAGKSTIMQTIAELLEELGILGGSFFFSLENDKQNNKSYLIATLAHQLAMNVPGFAQHVSASIDCEPAIFSQTLTAQMKALIIDPMSASARDNPQSSGWIYVILIDALDECSPKTSYREIITLLADCAAPPFRVLVASRPESVIQGTFYSLQSIKEIETLPLYNNLFDDDIALYLTDKFCEIKANHPSIPDSWPHQSDFDTLVGNASGHFVYASTIIKYLENSEGNPMTNLKHILAGSNIGQLAQLDDLYNVILGPVADKDSLRSILHCIIYMPGLTASGLDAIFGYATGTVDTLLRDVHSLLQIPATSTSSSDRDDFIRFYHASAVDFLSDPFRAGNFYISPPDAKALIATSLIKQNQALRRGKHSKLFTGHFRQILEGSSLATDSELMSALSEYDPSTWLGISTEVPVPPPLLE